MRWSDIMKNIIIIVLLILIGVFFVYKAIIETDGIDIILGYPFVVLIAYIIIKKNLI
jgi:hypothetical protein